MENEQVKPEPFFEPDSSAEALHEIVAENVKSALGGQY